MTSYMDCRMSEDSEYLTLAAEFEQLVILTISPLTGEIFKTQALTFATPLRSRPLLASFSDQEVFLGFNSNFDDVEESKLVKMSQSSTRLVP